MFDLFGFKKLLFFMPLILFTNLAFAENAEIQVDWILEGQLNEQFMTKSGTQTISDLESYIERESEESKIIYDKFVTNNEYSIGENKITINSDEGQALNNVLIEQQELRLDSFMHKIKYYDRFSDGYVQIAESLLDPVGEQKYLVNGRSYDYYPHSNLEYFVLERGYDLDNLEEIPNYIFSPAALDIAREMIAESLRQGETFNDLRDLSPNYMRLDESALQERMKETMLEQTTQIFDEIIINPEVMISQPQRNPFDLFDHFKLKQSQFENTRHVQDTLQDQSNALQRFTPMQNLQEYSMLLLIPVFTGLAILGYIMRKRLVSRKSLESLLQVTQTQIDYAAHTKGMLDDSMNLYQNNQIKEAHEKLSQAIRYYYSRKLGIDAEITNFELLLNLKKVRIREYEKIRKWIMLCGSVEYAKYKSENNDFADAISKFLQIIS